MKKQTKSWKEQKQKKQKQKKRKLHGDEAARAAGLRSLKIDNIKKFKIQGRHSTSVSFPLEIKGIFYVFSMQSFALEARAKIENALISI